MVTFDGTCANSTFDWAECPESVGDEPLLFANGSGLSYAKSPHVLQAKPVVVLEPSEVYLFSVRWSPFRPLVCAVAAGDGRVFIYDLAASMLHPVKSIDVTGRRAPVHAISFNPKLKQYLAAGDGPRVKVYEMGPRLTEARAQEQRMADRLAEMEGANEEE